MSPSIVVAYCTNAAMAVPMRVSAYTLLAHLGQKTQIHVHLVQEDWTRRDKNQLKQILERSGRTQTLTIHDADLSPFAALPSLQGDRTTYARLLLPDLIGAERILYIDSDTLPLMDVTEIYGAELEGNVLGAVAWNVTAAMALDRTVLLSEGVPEDAPYFNAGVLIIDAERFCAERIYERCMEAAYRIGNQLVSHDQTLLNLLLHGRIKPLRWGYNVRLGHDEPLYTSQGLAHFVGAMKPWDLFARWLHSNTPLWKHWARQAGEGALPVSRSFLRAFQLGPVYAKALRARLAQHREVRP